MFLYKNPFFSVSSILSIAITLIGINGGYFLPGMFLPGMFNLPGMFVYFSKKKLRLIS